MTMWKEGADPTLAPDPSILLKHLGPNYREGRSHVKNVVENALRGPLGPIVANTKAAKLATLFAPYMGGPVHNGSNSRWLYPYAY